MTFSFGGESLLDFPEQVTTIPYPNPDRTNERRTSPTDNVQSVRSQTSNKQKPLFRPHEILVHSSPLKSPGCPWTTSIL